MKKNSLATAIIAAAVGTAGMMGAAQAINLNPDGLGQVLLYPYYTVNGGNSTVVTVVNTTDRVKAVKVRFVEALNSAEVLDFNLYLSPYDVWAANVVADGDTGARLLTEDTSCTVPQIVSGTSFLPWEFMENNPDALATRGLARVRQGHLEIIEMGNLQPGPLATAATHVNGTPVNCGALESAWDSGVWAANSSAQMDSPNGGLFGGATIVAAEYGRTLSYNADAIDGFYTLDGDLHYEPGSVLPSLGEAASHDALPPNVVRARVFNNGGLHTIDYAEGFDGVSAVLMSRYIYNEYNLNAGLEAASEWVVTFPTKRHYVHRAAAAQPFTKAFTADGSCHEYVVSYWDREERTTTRRLTVSPPRANPGFELCWEANVLAFGQTVSADTPTHILGATSSFGAHGLTGFDFQEGWARIEFDTPASNFQYYLPGGSEDQTLIGQPVIGFWASELQNGELLDGLVANYGVTFKHRVSRDCRIHTGTGSVSSNAAVCPR